MKKLVQMQTVIDSAVKDSFVTGEFSSSVLYANLMVGSLAISRGIDVEGEEFDSIAIITEILENDLFGEIEKTSLYKFMEKAADKQIDYEMSFIRQLNKVITTATAFNEVVEKAGIDMKDFNIEKLAKELLENPKAETLQLFNSLVNSTLNA